MGEQRLLPPAYFSQFRDGAEHVPAPGWPNYLPQFYNLAESVPPPGWPRCFSQFQGRGASVPPPGWVTYWPQSQDRAEPVPQPSWALYWPQSQDRGASVPQPGWALYWPQSQDRAEPVVAPSDGRGSQPLGTGRCGPRRAPAASSEPPRWVKVLAPIAYKPLRFWPPAVGEEKRLGAARRPVKKLQLEDEICEVGIYLKKLELLALIGERIDRYQYKLLEALRDEKIQCQKARKTWRRWLDILSLENNFMDLQHYFSPY